MVLGNQICIDLFRVGYIENESNHNAIEGNIQCVGERLQCYSLVRLLTIEVCLNFSIAIFPQRTVCQCHKTFYNILFLIKILELKLQEAKNDLHQRTNRIVGDSL